MDKPLLKYFQHWPSFGGTTEKHISTIHTSVGGFNFTVQRLFHE